MAKFIVEIYLDGLEAEEGSKEYEDACEDFVYEQLNMTASCVKIIKIHDYKITAEYEENKENKNG